MDKERRWGGNQEGRGVLRAEMGWRVSEERRAVWTKKGGKGAGGCRGCAE